MGERITLIDSESPQTSFLSCKVYPCLSVLMYLITPSEHLQCIQARALR